MPRAASGESSRRRRRASRVAPGPGRAVTWARTSSVAAGSSGDVLNPAPSTVTPSSFHSRPGATPSSAKVTAPDLSASRASLTRCAGPAGGPRGEAGRRGSDLGRRRCRIRGLLGGRGSGGGLRTAEQGEHVDVPLLVARGLEAEALDLDGAEQHVARQEVHPLDRDGEPVRRQKRGRAVALDHRQRFQLHLAGHARLPQRIARPHPLELESEAELAGLRNGGEVGWQVWVAPAPGRSR